MEQVKRKQITDGEIVCQFMNTDTGEIEYSLREGDSLRVYTKEQKEYMANRKVIKKNNTFVKVYKDTIGILAREDLTKSDYKLILIALSYLDKTSGVLIEDGVNISKARFLELSEPKKNTLEYDLNFILDNGMDEYLKRQQEHENKKKEFMGLFRECFDEICFYMEKDPKRRVSVNCFTCVKGMDLRDKYGRLKK